ncbi:MAG TPA: energy transducer TonB [Terriglobia bacterium]|nr:energy transducer TonB [Terriglobia bacterium]
MFDETLLDSAPSHAPVLTNVHWIIALAAAVAGYFAGNYGLPLLTAAEGKVIVTQSIILAALVGSYALMLCYVYADAKHYGFGVAKWFLLTLVLYLVGFVLYLIYSASKTGNWKRATMPIAYIFEVILVGVLVLLPLINYGELPASTLTVSLTAPPPPPPPPPPPAAAPPKVIVHRVTVEDIMKAPTVIPKTIKQLKEEPEPPPQMAAVGVVGGVPGGVPGGSAGGVIGGIIGGVGTAPPPPPPPKAATPKRIRVGGQVESAKLIFQPKPEYPPLAKMARIQGTVRLEAVISKDGTIQDLKVVSGHPLLVKAALEAVQRWRYQPTLLNGEPVEVVTEIDVNFTLAE